MNLTNTGIATKDKSEEFDTAQSQPIFAEINCKYIYIHIIYIYILYIYINLLKCAPAWWGLHFGISRQTCGHDVVLRTRVKIWGFKTIHMKHHRQYIHVIRQHIFHWQTYGNNVKSSEIVKAQGDVRWSTKTCLSLTAAVFSTVSTGVKASPSTPTTPEGNSHGRPRRICYHFFSVWPRLNHGDGHGTCVRFFRKMAFEHYDCKNGLV